VGIGSFFNIGGFVMLVRFNDRLNFPAFGARRALPVSALRRELDRLIGDLERAPSLANAFTQALSFDDTGEALTLRAELPGITEKDIDINVTSNTLTVKATRTTETPEGYAAHRRERQSFSFAQSYELPTRVDPERVQASLKQGVLTLTLPKVAEAQPKKVTVTATA